MNRIIRVVMVENIVAKKEKIRDVLFSYEDIKIVADLGNGESAIEAVNKYSPDVLIISENCEGRNAYDVSQILSVENPNLVIIMLGERYDSAMIKKAMKAGVKDYIDYSEIESNLINSIYESIKVIDTYSIEKTNRNGKIISFISAKGSAGKSTIAINIATSMAKEFAARDIKKKILVIDFDLQFGDIAFLTNISPEATLDALADVEQIDYDMVDNMICPKKEYGLYILPAPTRPEYESKISIDVLNDLLEIVRVQFDYILIDSIQGFQNATIAAVTNSDLIMVVSPADLYNIKNGMIALETLDMMGIESGKVKYIVNKYERRNIKLNDIESKISKKIFQTIPLDRDTAYEASEAGEPIVISYPKSSLAKALKTLSLKILEEFEPEEYEVSTGLFEKIFK